MRRLGSQQVLAAWERGRGRSAVDRALVLLSAAAGEPPAELAALTVGQRDRRLLELRGATFGASMACFVCCPKCAAELEFELATASLLLDAAADTESELTEGDYRVRFRLPNSHDLRAAGVASSREAAARCLLERCVIEAHRGEDPIGSGALPDSVADRLSEAMEELDPQASITMNLTCPDCGGRFVSTFDIGEYLWTEVDREAKRLLRQVHHLASRYCWSEAEILALSEARRRAYLELMAAT